MRDVRQQSCIKLKTMEDTGQSRAKTENHMCFLASMGTNATIQEQHTEKRVDERSQ